ncbi:MAG: hypothetical protein R3A79_27170 [Nannocystaceae bacterium]
MRALLASLLLLCGACPPADGETSATASSTSTAGTSSGGASSTTDACEGASDCDTDGICVADYVGDTLGGERGPARCVAESECIGPLDLQRWCFGHPSCCEGLRCRSVDGICEEPDLGEGTDTAGTGTSGTAGTTGASDTSTASDTADSDATTDATTGGTDTDTDTDGTSTTG